MDEADLYVKIAKTYGILTSTYQHKRWFVSLTIGAVDCQTRHYSQEKALTRLISLVDRTSEWNRAVMDYIQIVDTTYTDGRPTILFRLFQRNALKIRKTGNSYEVSCALHPLTVTESTVYAGLQVLAKLLHTHPCWQSTVNQWVKDQREHELADKKDHLSKTLLWQWLEKIGPLEISRVRLLKTISYRISVWDISREYTGCIAFGDSRTDALKKLGDEVAVHNRYQWAAIINEYYREQQELQSLSDGLVVKADAAV